MSTIHPDRKKRVRAALRWFFIAAWVIGVWLLILTTRIIAQYRIVLGSANRNADQ